MAVATINNDELWRECAGWLTRCQILRIDHRANWHSATIVDLAGILRDGVLLCNLLNSLDSGCIDLKDVNQKPQMAQFLCLRNIQLFLRTCKEIFLLRESDLFEPLMLFDLTNFHRVLCTLSKLSNSQKVQRKNIRGFSAHKSGSQEDIYQSLQSITQSELGTECSWMKFSIKCPPLEEHDEEVYEDLCYVTFSPNLSQLLLACYKCISDAPIQRNQLIDDQDEFGGYYSHIRDEEIYQDLMSVQQSSTAPPVEKRDYVIKELVDTEKNYVDVLNVLKGGFMKPLSHILSPEQSQIIFKKIPDLYEIHSGFLMQLKLFYSEGKPKLSSIFLNWREKFVIYGSYCANLTNALNLLQDICDHHELFNEEVNKCQTEAHNGKFKLRDILCVPMQRILKYHLLLEKLIEETQRNHDDYNSLKRAREAMVDVAMYINEEKRDNDHLLLLRQVQDNISDWILPSENTFHSFGRLLWDGELKIKLHPEHKNHLRYAFIFDRIMILCKAKNNQFSFKESFQLSEYNIEDPILRPILGSGARWSYQWVLVRVNRNDALTLYARTIDIKNKVIKALQEAKDNVEPSSAKNTNHRFEINTFESPVTCNRCSKFLKGLFYQGYICKVCTIAVHKECIGQSGRCELPPLIPSHSHNMDELIDKLWFAGELERSQASTALENRIVGTYLLRIRHQSSDVPYALSLKTIDTVRHMRIFKKKIEDIDQYFLSESRFFKSVLDLVHFYQNESLRENYERLDECTKLQWPYKQIIAVAECDYLPQENGHLPLRQGRQVIVFNIDERDGWWKGKYCNRIGIFPKKCVKVLKEVTQDIEC